MAKGLSDPRWKSVRDYNGNRDVYPRYQIQGPWLCPGGTGFERSYWVAHSAGGTIKHRCVSANLDYEDLSTSPMSPFSRMPILRRHSGCHAADGHLSSNRASAVSPSITYLCLGHYFWSTRKRMKGSRSEVALPRMEAWQPSREKEGIYKNIHVQLINTA